MTPLVIDSPSIGRCASCGRRISRAGCPEHGQPQTYSTASEEDAFAVEVRPEKPLFPHYDVDRVLGRGGFGTVYRARHEDGKIVAIKHSRADVPESSERLLRESEVLRAVAPPHVPELVEYGAFADGTQFLVMEFIGVPSLAELLAHRGFFPIADCLAIATALLRPLAAVHARGYVHRDLKPENVLYDELHGRAVLIDFGLSRADRALPADPLEELTVEGMLVGTTDYMAPEQHEGRLDLDATADVYALGIILFEMLTGRIPFFGPAALVREAHRSQRPPRPASFVPGIPAEFEDIILRCLAKSPSDRFPNAQAVALALDRISRQSPYIEQDPSILEAPPSRRGVRARSELRTMSILRFTSSLDGIALRRALEPKGAHIVFMGGGRCVAAFGPGIDTNPARRALLVARGLLAEGRAQRIMIDIKQVTVRISPNGGYRVLAPQVARDIPFPETSALDDIVVSNAARAVLETSELVGTLPLSSVTNAPSGIPSGGTPPTPGGELFGRDVLLDAILSAAHGAIQESRSTAIVVIAESGHGKSQIRRALSIRLQTAKPTATIVNVLARAPADGGARGTVRELLLGALLLPATMPERIWMELLVSRLGLGGEANEVQPAEVAALALALGWITPGQTPDDPEIARALAGLEAAPGAIRTQWIAAAVRALRRRAREAPLFILLDDAHYADDATITILDQATRAGEDDAPIFVCALGRQAFADLHPSFGARAAFRETFTVGALDADSAAELCRELLRPVENVPSSAIHRIVERAQGIPLLLVELVRGIKAAGLVRMHSAGGGHYLATDELDRWPELPLIEWLVHRELDGLSDGARAHAQLAAVLGMEVTNAELEGVLQRLDRVGLGDEFPLDARIGSERLVAHGLFRRAGPDRYRFRHSLLREAIARTVADELRPTLHRAAVDHWRRIDAPGDAMALAKLAHHAACAGDQALAEAASLSLAESARARHDYLEAERRYTEALDQSANPGENSVRRRHVLRGRGLMRYRLGRYADARVDLAAARTSALLSNDKLDEAEILLDEATVLDWMGEHSASASCVDQAMGKVSLEDISPLLKARLSLGRGRSLHRASLEKQAYEELERVVLVTESLGEEAYETRVIALLMSSFILQGLARLEDASRALDRVVAECETHGDLLHLASGVNNRALLAGCLGDKPGMVKDFERVISLGQHLGQDAIQIAGHYNLGEYLYLWGDVEKAIPHAERALRLEMLRTSNAPRMELELLPARLALYRGDLPYARQLVVAIRARARAAVSPAIDVLCTMVEFATGDATFEAWAALETRSEQFSIGQERIEVIEARALAALRKGLANEAHGHFSRAIEAARSIPNVMGERLARRMKS